MALKERGKKTVSAKEYSQQNAGTLKESRGLDNGKQIESENKAAADTIKGRGVYQDVPVELVDLDAEQPRQDNKPSLDLVKQLRDKYQAFKLFIQGDPKGFDPDQLQDFYPEQSAMLVRFFYFAYDIDSKTLLHPINVYKENGRYIVAQGERRFLSHVLMNKKYIATIVRPHPIKTGETVHELEHRISQFSENFQREGLSAKDKIESAYKISSLYNKLNNKSPSVRELSRLLHVSRGAAAKYQNIIGSPEAMEKARHDNEVTLSQLLEVISDESQIEQSGMGKNTGSDKKKGVGRKPKVDLGKVENPAVVHRLLSLCTDSPDTDYPDTDWTDAKAVKKVWDVFMQKLIKDEMS